MNYELLSSYKSIDLSNVVYHNLWILQSKWHITTNLIDSDRKNFVNWMGPQCIRLCHETCEISRVCYKTLFKTFGFMHIQDYFEKHNYIPS